MAAKIQRVARKALQTFTNFSSVAVFNENLQQLRAQLDQVGPKDLNFNPALVASQNEESSKGFPESCAPVTYIHLYEDHVFTMGIFVLKRGVRLPLHDHPGMYGMIKVLHGTASISCYSERKDRAVPEKIARQLKPSWQLDLIKVVERHPSLSVTPNSAPCILAPHDRNLHEIHAYDAPVAFLDILAPPYDHETGTRKCHYYRELDVSGGGDFNIQSELVEDFSGFSGRTNDPRSGNPHLESKPSYLVRIPQPSDFWCDTAGYEGPDIDPYKAYS